VSWAAPGQAARARLRLGRPAHGHGLEVPAEERTYTEALTGETVWTYHARLDRLQPDTQYVFEVLSDGATPVPGMFRTGPHGRSGGFRFTSFGDQAIPAPVGTGLGPNTPNAGFIVPAVEGLNPLFHLFNGDLCYANVSDAPVATWASFFNNNTRSAANRPWMPSAGNHENEVGNGPQGYLSYQTRFELPDNGSADFRGNWYAFTVGSIRVISLNNDDVCLQDGAFSAFRRDHVPTYVSNGDNPYINGYSTGAQRAWLERELASARRSDDIDWIVVCMHQVAMSSAHFNGADLGIRQNWLPLFDAYGVDLVVAGHEHHFERTFPVRGVLSGSSLLTPAPQSSDPAVMDTSLGTVHMIIGGGGHSTPTPVADFDMPHDGVLITGVGPGSPQVQHPSITTTEPAPWSAYRDLQTP
jgi:Calcineurin-like phosphoesterase/Purple acid Phosphatase, N-terminal domain